MGQYRVQGMMIAYNRFAPISSMEVEILLFKYIGVPF